MKKLLKGLMAVALMFTSVFTVAGCGKDDDGDNVVELTKADYIEVFDSVTSTYSSFNLIF